jgi:hypothetical protein
MLGKGLVQGIVLRERTISRVKHKIYDWAPITLVHYFLLGGITFGELGLHVLTVVCVATTRLEGIIFGEFGLHVLIVVCVATTRF